MNTGATNAPTVEGLCAYGFDEIGRFDVEHLRQCSNRQQAYVLLAAFQRADGIAMEIGKFRETFLRQPAFLSNLTQSLAECYQDLIFGIWHAGTVRSESPKVYTV